MEANPPLTHAMPTNSQVGFCCCCYLYLFVFNENPLLPKKDLKRKLSLIERREGARENWWEFSTHSALWNWVIVFKSLIFCMISLLFKYAFQTIYLFINNFDIFMCHGWTGLINNPPIRPGLYEPGLHLVGWLVKILYMTIHIDLSIVCKFPFEVIIVLYYIYISLIEGFDHVNQASFWYSLKDSWTRSTLVKNKFAKVHFLAQYWIPRTS